MKYVYGFVVLTLLILAIDLAWAHLLDWKRERKRQRDLKRFAMSPFRGVKKFDDGMFS
jgi:hypothetical protein